MDKRQERHIGDHDWHSSEYVNDWIGRDVQRDDERRSLLQQMLERAGLASDAEIQVLDVGAGYGVVSEEVLRRFSARADYVAGLFRADVRAGTPPARPP